MELTFIIPCYNARPNLPLLIGSLLEQNDQDWKAIFIDDMSEDGTKDYLSSLEDSRFRIVINNEKKFALRNIVETARDLAGIIAVIDGDDQLCNPNTVSILKNAHDKPGLVVWTAHKWDVNGMNISRDMPNGINPYQYDWCASHLRTFDAGLLKLIPTVNFQDHLGRWFVRGYDQALMLPLLHVASGRKFISEVCYLYRINSCSMPDRDWTENRQLTTINFVRARGFVTA